MRNKVILEKGGKWSVVYCIVKGSMLETGNRNFRFDSEMEALESISDDYVEMQNEMIALIFGDSFRRIFVHKMDLQKEEF
jgi:hypothetical protein